MQYPHYALDFGTTNSSIAICEAKDRHRLLDIDPRTKIPHTVRSLFCIEKNGATSIGEEAVKRYTHAVATIPLDIRQKMKLVLNVDEGGFVKTANFREALAEYKGFDVPARLFQSPKMLLRYIGAATAVFGKKYTVQDIAYGFLKELKEKADKIVGRPINRLVCSRPVRFAVEDFPEKYATKTWMRFCAASASARLNTPTSRSRPPKALSANLKNRSASWCLTAAAARPISP